MKSKRMGQTGLKVTEICLGTMTFGMQCDEATSFAIMDKAVEHGVDFFDTADGYPMGGTIKTAGATETIDSNPGHGLALRPHGSNAAPTLTYVCKTDPTHWVVKEFDLATKKVTVIADALPGSEDLAWDPIRDILFMAKGPKVFVVDKQSKTGWGEQGDFTSAGIDHITRLAIKNGPGPRLVFVAEPVSK